MDNSQSTAQAREILEGLLETYVDHHLQWGLPPRLEDHCVDRELLPEFRKMVKRYHRLDSSFGVPLKDLTGRTIGPYRVLKQMATGHRSAIYNALDSSNGRKVALKVLPLHFDWGEGRFADYCERCSRVIEKAPPGVVKLFEIGEVGGLELIAMEVVSGVSPSAEVSGSVSSKAARELLPQFFRSLAEVHTAGLVIADVSPSSYLVREGSVVLMPYGSSGILADSVSEVGAAASDFAAPEVARCGQATAAADVFSAAAVAYQLLVGSTPVDGNSARAPKAIEESLSSAGLPERATEALTFALAREADERPTAEEVALACG